MDKSNSVFRMISTLVIIAVVLAAALAVVNQKTAPLIEQNSENQLQELWTPTSLPLRKKMMI